MINIYLNSFIFEILFFILLLFLLLQKTGISITNNLFNAKSLFYNTCKLIIFFFEAFFLIFIFKIFFTTISLFITNHFSREFENLYLLITNPWGLENIHSLKIFIYLQFEIINFINIFLYIQLVTFENLIFIVYKTIITGLVAITLNIIITASTIHTFSLFYIILHLKYLTIIVKFITFFALFNIFNTYNILFNIVNYKNLIFLSICKTYTIMFKLMLFNIYNIYNIILTLINYKNLIWLEYSNILPIFNNFTNFYFSPDSVHYKLFDYSNFTFLNKYILLVFITIYYFLIYYYYKNSLNKKYQLLFTYEYPILLGFLLFGYIFVVSTNNLFIVYLGFEIQTFTILLLSGQIRNLYLVVITNLKYFFYSFLSSLFFLIGLLYIYNFSGTLNYYELYYYFLYNHSWNLSNFFLIAGLNFLLLSFIFKLGLFPFYIWVLDIFEGYPRLITLLLLTLNKFNLYIFLLKFITIIASFNMLVFNYTIHFLTLISLISIFIGSWLALTQTNLQRFFGATSITHLGFLMLLLKINLLNYSFNNLYLIYSYFILYMVLTYIFFGALIIWSGVLSTHNFIKPNNFYFNYIKDISWFNVYSKKTLIALILVLLNLSGFPPFSFFYIKFNLIWLLGSVSSNLDLVLLLYFSTLITGSYIRLISIIWLENNLTNANNLYLYKYYLQQSFINLNLKKNIVKLEYFFVTITIITLSYNYLIFLF